MAAPPVDLRRVIPNWRDFSVYSAIERLSPRCLAAEFLRRNHNYQRWWRDHVDYEGYIDLDGLSRFVDLDGLSRFGLVNPIDINGVPRITLFLPTAGRYLRGSEDGLAKNEVAVVFDLSLPLDEQMADAARALKRLQKDRIKKGEIDARGTRQVRKQDYVRYLRLLDAEACGAAYAEIGEILYPQVSDDYPDRRRTKTLSDNRKVAHQLRDGGYLRLAAKIRKRPKRR